MAKMLGPFGLQKKELIFALFLFCYHQGSKCLKKNTALELSNCLPYSYS